MIFDKKVYTAQFCIEIFSNRKRLDNNFNQYVFVFSSRRANNCAQSNTY